MPALAPCPAPDRPAAPAGPRHTRALLQVAGAASAAEFAQALAARLAGAAHRQSLDPAFPSPFAAELQERAAVDMGVMEPRAGGKPDDATAVVALVARA